MQGTQNGGSTVNRFLIEDVRVGISKGGIACGPVPGNVIGEIVLRDEDGKAAYHCMAEVSGTLNFYKSESSIYKEQIDEDFENAEFTDLLESSFTEGYDCYYDFYEEVNAMQPLSVTARIQNYLAFIVRADWPEIDRLKADTVGKLISDIELLLCDAEADHLEEINDEDKKGDKNL